MLDWIALACIIGAALLLAALSAIDLKSRLLPNEMVAGFATLGIIFHLTTLSAFLDTADVILGGITGFSTLYIIRFVANKYYGQDALGLGDVKLIGAGGIWLGPDGIMLAMSVGAFAALLHGLGYALYVRQKTGKPPTLSSLQIPAGPGFATGLIIAGAFYFHDFGDMLL